MIKSTLKYLIAAALTTASVFCAAADGTEGKPVHNFASYNIRYTNNTEDTDANGRSWAVRGEYVMRLIRDYDFDIVGMQEVSGRNGKHCINPNTGRSQLEDMQATLTEYSFLCYERSGNNNAADYSYNVIAYKSDKYTVIDNGCFWLRPTPDTPGTGWDPDPSYSGIWRTCGWARMKDNASGREFIFAVTHVNYGPSLDGKNSGIVISDRLTKIAGTLPVLLVGDFNMRRTDHEEAYRNYACTFADAALTAKESKCIPEENGQVSFTANNWLPATQSGCSGSEFDFCFYRRMTVEKRYVITENYGRAVNPSDHFPTLIQCTLDDPTDQETTTIHVDATASATGDGSVSAPFRTIAEAMAASDFGGTILVAEGVYDETLELPFTLTLRGGYDSSFASVTGKTTLHGSVSVPHYHNLAVSDFAFEGTADSGVAFNGSALTLDNCSFSGYSATNGGAVNSTCFSSSFHNCSFTGNTATNFGGAVYVNAFENVDFTDCLFQGNSAKSGGGAYVKNCNELLVYGSTFTANDVTASGGGIYLDKSASNKYFNLVNDTFANNTLNGKSALATVVKSYGGAAISAHLGDDARFNMAHCTIAGNNAVFGGSNKSNFQAAALNIYGGSYCLMNNIVAGNSSDAEYADLAVDQSTLSKESNNVYSTYFSTNIELSDKTTYAPDAATAVANLAAMLDGTADGSSFTANVADNGGRTPTVAVRSGKFGDKGLNTLITFDRLLKSSFGCEVPGLEGAGYLSLDQRGETRLAKSMPGAVEFSESLPSAVTDIESDSDNTGAARYYNLQGMEIKNPSAGIYIRRTANGSQKVLIK